MENTQTLRSNPVIYPAGKPYNAPLFRLMRDVHGYNILARWIDLSKQASLNKMLVWELCCEDASSADMVIIYNHVFDDYLLGTLVEAGHVMGAGMATKGYANPVYCINNSVNVTPSEKSDCAFTFHPHWFNIEATGILNGYRKAMGHYCENFMGQSK